MTQTFDVVPLRFICRDHSPDANFLRGGFGKSLRQIDRAAYTRLFEPQSRDGPSGLRDAPRPFVLRVRDREFGFHLFDTREPIEPVIEAFRKFAAIDHWERGDVRRLCLAPTRDASRIRVKFVTPTELKGADRPDFDVLFARIRDRISTLRSLYQGGPLDIDFRAIGHRAAKIKMTRCELEHVEAQRTSRRTGQTHSLGGFVGFVEYQGNLGEFLPYLEISRWTGVGRQTVWGKGEIDCETF